MSMFGTTKASNDPSATVASKDPSATVAPLFTTGTDPIKQSDDDDDANENVFDRRRRHLRDRGYALVDDNDDNNDDDDDDGKKNAIDQHRFIQPLRRGIELLHQQGLPASFILLFDVTWQLARISWWNIMKPSTLESNQFHFDLLAWYIESQGFSPHRDRQPDDVLSSFAQLPVSSASKHRTGLHPIKQSNKEEEEQEEEQQQQPSLRPTTTTSTSITVNPEPKLVTHWIALTEASPENSCLYVIPKDRDPGYLDGDTNHKDPLQRALPNKEAFQHVRCIPRQAGQSILFTHRIIHWGSRRDPDSMLPNRIAISFVCCDPTFEKPYIDPTYFTQERNPPFSIRLLLVCAQLLIYYQRFQLSRACIMACYEYCKQYEHELEPSYRTKVFYEFVKAMKEQAANDAAQEDGDDDSEDEAVMEEMLNAEQRGYGEFDDDYDDHHDEQNMRDEVTDEQEEDCDGHDEGDEEELESKFGGNLFGQQAEKQESTQRGRRKRFKSST